MQGALFAAAAATRTAAMINVGVEQQTTGLGHATFHDPGARAASGGPGQRKGRVTTIWWSSRPARAGGIAWDRIGRID